MPSADHGRRVTCRTYGGLLREAGLSSGLVDDATWGGQATLSRLRPVWASPRSARLSAGLRSLLGSASPRRIRVGRCASARRCSCAVTAVKARQRSLGRVAGLLPIRSAATPAFGMRRTSGMSRSVRGWDCRSPGVRRAACKPGPGRHVSAFAPSSSSKR